MSICRVCKREKLPEDFYAHSESVGGRMHICKECFRLNSRKWRLAHREELIKKRASEDKEKKREYFKQYEEKNKERLLSYRKEYWTVHREEHLKSMREYAKQHPEGHYLSCARYNRKHRLVVNMKALVRYKLGKQIDDSEWESLKKKYKNTCLCCGRKEPEIKLQRDHIVPVSRNGKGDVGNIQPLCGECNKLKSSNIMDYRPSFYREVLQAC